MGYAVVSPQLAEGSASVALAGDQFVFENPFLRAIFQTDGSLVNLVEKSSGRECVPAGSAGNHFVLFDDNPANWEAWDVDAFHLEKRDEAAGALSARVIEAGPLRAAVEFTYALSPVSTLSQIVSLTAVSRRLDFLTDVDWHESHRFLKVEFPLQVRAQNATYEIQFGHLQRPTHMNTSWDMARFEVCAHKWADLSEPDFGVTLFNDCKYGYSAHGNVLRLSLLRSPKSPDPTADMGRHTFRYGLMPHAGSIQRSGVVQEGYDFNVPLLVSGSGAAPAEVTFFQVDTPAVVIDTVKKAEDSGDIIVRLYEAHGCRGAVKLSTCLPVASAARCNLLEEQDEPVQWNGDHVCFEIQPFQLVTFKLKMAD
jgi:alpha-mannosidase